MAGRDVVEKRGEGIDPFTVHDLRRTASTLLHEAGYNTDWIEKCLAHEQKGVRAVYNKAEYAQQRRGMLQDWADMVESWIHDGPSPVYVGAGPGVSRISGLISSSGHVSLRDVAVVPPTS